MANENNNTNKAENTGNTIKEPDNWKTGDEPMTGAQKSYLETLSEQAGETIDENLSKAEASKRIDELRNNSQQTTEGGGTENTIKNPDNWKTGDEPMTGAQKSYLQTLSEEAGVDLDENLTKAEAAKQIEELQNKTGRGKA